MAKVKNRPFRTNFGAPEPTPGGGGSMDDFTVAGGSGPSQTISDDNTFYKNYIAWGINSIPSGRDYRIGESWLGMQ